MKCDVVRDVLLEADAADLIEIHGEVESHLRACESCSSLRRSIVSQHEAVSRQLQFLTPRRSAAETADAVLSQSAEFHAEADAGEKAILASIAIQAAKRKRRGVMALTAASLLAASIAGVVVVTQPVPMPPREQPVADAVPIQVEVPPGKTAIVFNTRNPKITVVWIHSGD